MSIFDNLKEDQTIKEDEDNLGGFKTLPSGLYDLTITLPYFSFSQGGALALNIVFITKDKQELKAQFWVTSGTAKGCHNYYIDARSGDKRYLPGFNMANALTMMTIGKKLANAATEEKVINLYSYEEGKNVPTQVQVITEMINTQIIGGVLEQKVNKRAKNDATGKYEPTAETRTENEIDKFFHSTTGLTLAEAKAKQKKPEFKNKWEKKWAGEIKDKTVKVKNTSFTSNTNNETPQKESLFND